MDVLDLSYKIFTLYHRCLLDFLSFAVYFICLLCIFSLSISTICLWIGVRYLPSPFLPLIGLVWDSCLLHSFHWTLQMTTCTMMIMPLLCKEVNLNHFPNHHVPPDAKAWRISLLRPFTNPLSSSWNQRLKNASEMRKWVDGCYLKAPPYSSFFVWQNGYWKQQLNFLWFDN